MEVARREIQFELETIKVWVEMSTIVTKSGFVPVLTAIPGRV